VRQIQPYSSTHNTTTTHTQQRGTGMEKVFEDKHITLKLAGFDPTSCEAQFIIDEREDNVGFYYITVVFESGDQTRLDYDGGNSKRDKSPVIKSSHLKDSIANISAIRVRD
jgi:hypothetical protein